MNDHGGTWAAAGEVTRLRREVLTRVRRSSRGDDADQVAQRLGREFAAAGIPQPPEIVRTFAAGIASGRWPGLPFVGQLVDLAVHRRIPAGLRGQARHLPRGRWVPVTLVDTVMARTALSHTLLIQRWFTEAKADPDADPDADALASPSVRLFAMPDPHGGADQVAVLVGSSFAGTVPAGLGPDLLTAIAAADAADERLVAYARVRESPGGLVLEVAIGESGS